MNVIAIKSIGCVGAVVASNDIMWVCDLNCMLRCVLLSDAQRTPLAMHSPARVTRLTRKIMIVLSVFIFWAAPG